MTILNLTQHTATPEQLAQGVVDLPAELRAELSRLLTVEDLLKDVALSASIAWRWCRSALSRLQ